MSLKVKFLVGSSIDYELLRQNSGLDENTLYWITDPDKHYLYKGSVLYAVGNDATQAASGLMSAADKAKLDALATGSVVDIENTDNSLVITTENGKHNLRVKVALSEDNLIGVVPGEEGGLEVAKSKIIESLAFKTAYDAQNNKIVTESDIAGLTGTLIFRGVFNKLEDVENPKNGNIAIVGNKEYVYADSDNSWHELGDEGLYLSQADAEATYLKKTDAASTYLTKTDAASTYATIADKEAIENDLDNFKKETQNNLKKVGGTVGEVRFEIRDLPEGCYAEYTGSNDIRIFIPEGTVFHDQQVGVGGDPTRFYATVRMYAPDDNSKFAKTGDFKNYQRDFVDDTSFKTVQHDSLNRPYVQYWIPIAKKNASNEWESFADKSIKDVGIMGSNCMVIFYGSENANDKTAVGMKRINLFSNEELMFDTLGAKDWYIMMLEKRIADSEKVLTWEPIAP